MKWRLNPKDFSLYSYFDDVTLGLFESQDVTFENHKDGILVETYSKYPELSDAFHLISTAFDRNGVEYGATVQHKKYPIYGVQFHPEKTSFIWVPTLPIPHNPVVRRISQNFANFIIDEASKNDNSFGTWQEVRANMFANFDYVMTTSSSSDIYLF